MSSDTIESTLRDKKMSTVKSRYSNYFGGLKNRCELLYGMRTIMLEELSSLKREIFLITSEIEQIDAMAIPYFETLRGFVTKFLELFQVSKNGVCIVRFFNIPSKKIKINVNHSRLLLLIGSASNRFMHGLLNL